MKIEENKIYTTIELEEVLHNKKRVLDRMCREKKIPAKKVGRNWMIEGKKLLDHLRKES